MLQTARRHGHDLVRDLELPPQIGRDELARNPGRSDVHPAVRRHLSTLEGAPVRAAVGQHLGPRDPILSIYRERAALAAAHVLHLVEREAAGVAEASERTPLDIAEQAVRGVLDHGEPVQFRQRRETGHVAGHARVVSRHDRPGAVRDRRGDPCRVQAEGVGRDVREHWSRTRLGHRGRGRGMGERRHDGLVARPQLGEQHRQLERRGARRGQQDQRAAESLPEPLGAQSRVPTASAKQAARSHLRHVLGPPAHAVGPVEWHAADVVWAQVTW
jgi:hypothetical protein